MAKLHIWKGDYANSVEFTSKYIDNRTAQVPEAFNIRGFAYYKLGNTAKALKDFASAKALENDYQPIFNYIQNDGKEVIKTLRMYNSFYQPTTPMSVKAGFTPMEKMISILK